MTNIRVMHFGLGPIGCAVVQQIAARPGFKIVGAIDIDSAKIGRDLGDIVGLGARRESGRRRRKALKSTKPDVVILCTTSSIGVIPQIETILKSKVNDRLDDRRAVVSGYTHTSGPGRFMRWRRRRKWRCSAPASTLASRWGTLPIALRRLRERVDRVVVNRVQDARIRRLPFQQKIGAS
jgi:4-hydroxy-tetrahydrodipicolinate reductase